MSKIIKISLVTVFLTVSAYATDFIEDIKVSGDVAFTSNYIWRGMTQTDDSAAIQGAFNLEYKGFYTGIWGSNVDFNGEDDAVVEIDFLAGYKNDVYGITYDIGYGQYTYPGDTDNMNFGEAHLTLVYDFDILAVSGSYFVGVDTNDVDYSYTNQESNWSPQNAYELSVSVPLPLKVSAAGTYGQYNHKGDYYSMGLTRGFGKFEVNVAYMVMEYRGGDSVDAENEYNVVATLSSSF